MEEKKTCKIRNQLLALAQRSEKERREDSILFVSRPRTLFFRFGFLLEHAWFVLRRRRLDVVFPRPSRPWPRSLSSSSSTLIRCSSTRRQMKRSRRRRRSPKTLLLLPRQQLPLPPLPPRLRRGPRPLTARVTSARGEHFVGFEKRATEKGERKAIGCCPIRGLVALASFFCFLFFFSSHTLSSSPLKTTKTQLQNPRGRHPEVRGPGVLPGHLVHDLVPGRHSLGRGPLERV